MSAELIAEIEAEAEKMWQERLATKATHNRTVLLQRLKLLRRAAVELKAVEQRITDACAEMDASQYGDPEVPFRMRAIIDPGRLRGPNGATSRDGGVI
jgi:hypothetical protein